MSKPSIKEEQLLEIKKDYFQMLEITGRAYKHIEKIPISNHKKEEGFIAYYAFVIYTKIYSLCENIGKIVRCSEDTKSWDYNLLSIIVRSQIEYSEMLFYTCLDEVSLSERSFREKCLRIDSKKQFYKHVSNLNNKDKQAVDKILNELKGEIRDVSELAHKTDFYNNLTENKRKKFECFAKETNFKRCNMFLPNRDKIEQKMKILNGGLYNYSYFMLSSYVHLKNITYDPQFLSAITSPEKASNMKMWESFFALFHSVLYLGFSTADFLYRLLLNEINYIFSKNEISEIRSILVEIKKNIDSINDKFCNS